MICQHCNQSLNRLMIIAMLQDAGARAGHRANQCWAREGGGEHEFMMQHTRFTLSAKTIEAAE